VKPPTAPLPILPPAPRPPKVEVKQSRMVHPWLAEAPGSWYRVQTVEDGRTKTVDIGLKARDAVSYTLLIQEAGGAVRESRTEVLPIDILGEESLSVEDQSWSCEVRGTKKDDGTYARTWVLSASRHAGAVLRQELPEGRLNTQRVWEHQLRIGSRSFDCLVVEAQIEGSGRLLKTWFCPTYPLGAVRTETDRGSTVLVAAGDDWATRPPLK
jgi:hypothetical protein